MKKRYFLIYMAVLIVCLTGVLGCKKKVEEELKPKVAETRFVDAEVEAWKEELARVPYSIDTKDLKNPFVGPVVGKTISYSEVVSFRLVGVVEKGGERIALLQDEGRIGYSVKKGSIIGNYRIVDVKKDRVLLEEEVTDIYGNKKKITRVLLLTRDFPSKESLQGETTSRE